MYNNIFTGLLDSSVWLEDMPTRLVWLTLLAAMDEDGFAQFASVANLAHRAVVPLEEAEEAVRILEGLDPKSCDPDNEGRRVERVQGGWVVLNASKYMEVMTRDAGKESNRLRVAKHRAARKEEFQARIEKLRYCECCGGEFEKPYSAFVTQDHDHVTGKARGIICQSCNKIVGLLEAGRTVASPKVPACTEYIRIHALTN